jgi:hypothetical protein
MVRADPTEVMLCLTEKFSASFRHSYESSRM